MLIDCDTCTVRGQACGDCVVTVLLGEPPGRLDVDHSEAQALQALAAGGLIPPLRLVPVESAPRERPAGPHERPADPPEAATG